MDCDTPMPRHGHHSTLDPVQLAAAADIETVLRTLAAELEPGGCDVELWGYALTVQVAAYDDDGRHYTRTIRLGPADGTVGHVQDLLQRGLRMTDGSAAR